MHIFAHCKTMDMDFKIKFSDIIKHLGLGIAMCALTIVLVPQISSAVTSEADKLSPVLENIRSVFDSTGIVGQVLLLVFAYIIGLLVQTVISILYGHGFNGMSIDEYCYCARQFGRFSDRDFPDWVFWSSRPDKVLRELTDQTELKLNSETRSEWLILNQLFEGIYFIMLVGLITLTAISGEIPMALKIAIFVVCFFQFLASKIRYFIRHQLFSLSAATLSFLLFIVAGAILSCHKVGNKYLFMAIGMLLTFLCARFFAKQHLLSMGSLCSSDKSSLDKLLCQTGLPTAFILIRTNTAKYLGKTLESIAKQNYPSVKVILLEDSVLRKDEAPMSVEDCIRTYEERFSKLNVLYYKSDKSGPCALSDEIQDLFLKVSTSRDVAIMVDSDDYLACDEVVSEIVTRIYRSGADICISSFEIFGKMSLNYAKDYHNILVRRISGLKLPLNYSLYNRLAHKDLVDDIYHISTIGWVKSYRRSVIENYVGIKRRSGYGDFVRKHGLRIYEDFPDILALLSSKAGVCAIHNPSHRFRKEEGSVTTSVGIENYRVQIPGFLALACMLSKAAASLTWQPKGTADFIRTRFSVYKFIQYLDVVLDKELAKAECLISEDGRRFGARDFVESYLQLLDEALSEVEGTKERSDGQWLKMAYLNEMKVIEKEKIMDFKHKELHYQVICDGIRSYNEFANQGK